MCGKLIVIEGLDGSGKGTQVHLLEQALLQEGKQVRAISFPDYQDPSSVLVRMYLNGEFGKDAYDTGAYAASVFYAADRYASFRRHWQTDYEKGVLFLANRYTQSNIIHQMAKLDRSCWKEYIEWLYDLEFVKMGIPQPDLVLFFDLDVTSSQQLLLTRYQGDEKRRDIHEKNQEYLAQCRETGLFAADALGWTVTHCQEGERLLSREEMACKVRQIIKEKLKI